MADLAAAVAMFSRSQRPQAWRRSCHHASRGRACPHSLRWRRHAQASHRLPSSRPGRDVMLTHLRREHDHGHRLARRPNSHGGRQRHAARQLCARQRTLGMRHARIPIPPAQVTREAGEPRKAVRTPWTQRDRDRPNGGEPRVAAEGRMVLGLFHPHRASTSQGIQQTRPHVPVRFMWLPDDPVCSGAMRADGQSAHRVGRWAGILRRASP